MKRKKKNEFVLVYLFQKHAKATLRLWQTHEKRIE